MKQNTIEENMSNKDIAFIEERKIKIDKSRQISRLRSLENKNLGDLFHEKPEIKSLYLFDKQ